MDFNNFCIFQPTLLPRNYSTCSSGMFFHSRNFICEGQVADGRDNQIHKINTLILRYSKIKHIIIKKIIIQILFFLYSVFFFQPHGYTTFLQMLPVLLLIVLTMMSSFFISDPIYSLHSSP